MNITHSEEHRRRRRKLLVKMAKKRPSDSSLSSLSRSFRNHIMENLRGEELDSSSDVSSHSSKSSKENKEDDFWDEGSKSLLVACRDVIDNVTSNLKAEIEEGISRSISRQSSFPAKSGNEQQADMLMSLAREDFAKTIKNDEEFHKLQREIRAKGATTSAAVKRITLARGA